MSATIEALLALTCFAFTGAMTAMLFL